MYEKIDTFDKPPNILLVSKEYVFKLPREQDYKLPIFIPGLIYNGLPPIKSDQARTSEGIPSLRGSFSLMH
jgi:hypothetical protein